LAEPGRGRATGLWTYFWLAVLFQFIPLWLLVVFSFQDSTNLTLPVQDWTLRWYRQIFETDALIASFQTSVFVALVSATIATAIGGLAGLALTRTRFPGRALFAVISMVPLVVPAIALAVALLVTMVALGVQLGRSTVIVGHAVIAVPYTALLVAVRFASFDRSLEEAALDLGASRWTILRRIHFPLALPALVPSFLFALVLSFDDFDLAFFLSGSDATLPVYFFSGLRRPALLPPVVALQSLIVIAVTVGIVIWELVRLRVKQRQGRRGAELRVRQGEMKT
jgi:spermidine/putrescine transport system permease protein